MTINTRMFDLFSDSSSGAGINGLSNNTKKLAKALPLVEEIQSKANGADDLSSCLSSIQEVSKYLNHQDKAVQSVAANVLSLLIKKAAEKLSNTEDPQKILKVAPFLLQMINKIDGKFDLAPGSENALKQAKNILTKTIENLAKGDEFVPFQAQNETNGNNLSSDRHFVKHLNKARQNLTGNITQDQFVSSIGQSINNLTGKI